MIDSLGEFVTRCENATNAEIYEMFEFYCTDRVRTLVFVFADSFSSEPFRSAMHNLGFTNY